MTPIRNVSKENDPMLFGLAALISVPDGYVKLAPGVPDIFNGVTRLVLLIQTIGFV